METSLQTQDPIIALMLTNRSTSKDDIDPDAENERRKRLGILLRNSKKYKRLAVQLANDKWSGINSDIDSSSSSDLNTSQIFRNNAKSRVNFSESVEIIPMDDQKKMAESVMETIKKLFLRKLSFRYNTRLS